MATRAQVEEARALATSNPPYGYAEAKARELQDEINRGRIPPEIEEANQDG